MLQDFLFLVGVFAFWYLLMGVILPKLGIPTCMSGACQLKQEQRKEENSDARE